MTEVWWWSRYKGEEVRTWGGEWSREGNVVDQYLLSSSLPSVAPISSVLFSHSLLFFSSPTLPHDRCALFELAGLDIWLRCI